LANLADGMLERYNYNWQDMNSPDGLDKNEATL